MVVGFERINGGKDVLQVDCIVRRRRIASINRVLGGVDSNVNTGEFKNGDVTIEDEVNPGLFQQSHTLSMIPTVIQIRLSRRLRRVVNRVNTNRIQPELLHVRNIQLAVRPIPARQPISQVLGHTLKDHNSQRKIHRAISVNKTSNRWR